MKFSCITTRDPPTKKRKRWLDGELVLLDGTLKLFVKLDESNEALSLVDTQLFKFPDLSCGQEVAFDSGWFCEVDCAVSETPLSIAPSMPLVTGRNNQASLYNIPPALQPPSLSQNLPAMNQHSNEPRISASPSVLAGASPSIIPNQAQPQFRRRTDQEILALFST